VRLTNGFAAAGGGIYNNGTLRLTEVSVESNTATRGGGGIYSVNTVTLHQSAVINNTANDYGGGIANDGGTLHVINSTISGNSALGTGSSGGGGAIDSYDTAPNMLFIQTTITNNTAVAPNAERSGIWQEAGTLTIRNSIIAKNIGGNCLFSGGTRSINAYNMEDASTCGFTGTYGIFADPRLLPLASNGGLTQTHALLPNSPAINGGFNADALDQTGAALTTDQRGAGFPRINGGTVDIGAVEAALSSLQVALTLQGRANPTPHASWVITAQVSVLPAGGGTPLLTQNFVTDQNGSLTIPNLPTGTYQFRIKGTHALARVFTLELLPGANSTQTNTLWEGDADGNNLVNVTDFSLLATAFSKSTGQQGFNALTDFNNDGLVNILDFSLLATNFGKSGDS